VGGAVGKVHHTKTSTVTFGAWGHPAKFFKGLGMENVTLVLDGITVQHVGDLVFETKETNNHRTECKETYRKCLEDVACAVLFADEIRISGNLPAYPGGLAPGQRVVDQLNEPSELVKRLPGDLSTPKEEILRTSSYRQIVGLDIVNLSRAIQDVPLLWTHLGIREAQINFGNDDSLRRENLAPADYVFAAKHYWSDSKLESLVPEAFVESLQRCVTQTATRTLASKKAIGVFFRKMALTHIGTFWTIHEACRLLKIPSNFRMPHATRMHLSTLRSKAIMDELQTTIMPLGLCVALHETGHRGEFVRNLKQLRDWKPVEAIRQRLRQAMHEASVGNNEGVRKLTKDITNLSLNMKSERDQLSVQRDFTFFHATPHGVEGVKIPVPDLNKIASEKLPLALTSGFQYWLKVLIRKAYGDNCESKLVTVFPELKTSS